jgi:hypothetical protein
LTALEEFRKAITLNPKWADVHISIGWVRVRQRRFVAAARSYRDAFTADQKPAASLQNQHRYHAARSATLAAAGHGEDAGDLADRERLVLRRHALAWLRADLARWSKQAEKGTPEARAAVKNALQHWQKDTDLGSVRDAAAQEKLPEAERAEWKKLWADVANPVEEVRREWAEVGPLSLRRETAPHCAGRSGVRRRNRFLLPEVVVSDSSQSRSPRWYFALEALGCLLILACLPALAADRRRFLPRAKTQPGRGWCCRCAANRCTTDTCIRAGQRFPCRCSAPTERL